MPDLNWKNEKVQDAMIDVAKYWLDLGVDGLELMRYHLARAPFVDAEPKDKPVVLDWFKFSNLPDVHIYLKVSKSIQTIRCVNNWRSCGEAN